jgi:hypothetical protein
MVAAAVSQFTFDMTMQFVDGVGDNGPFVAGKYQANHHVCRIEQSVQDISQPDVSARMDACDAVMIVHALTAALAGDSEHQDG